MQLSSVRYVVASMLMLGALACVDYDPVGVDESAINASVVQTIPPFVIGAPATSSIRFPFGGALSAFAGSRYQQAYAATSFATTTPITIEKISFLNGTGNFAASTYTFYLSTIASGIDNLSSTNFDGNRGTDNALFAVVALSGPAPATLTITGTPFLYDPSQGNLLLDIVITPRATVPSGPAFYASREDAFGIFARYQNFGFGNGAGMGLVTQFDVVQPIVPEEDPSIEAFLEAVQAAVADGSLTGSGGGNSAEGRLGAWLNMLASAQEALNSDTPENACAPLLQAYLRADGAPSQPDFVIGDALETLTLMLEELRAFLGCSR